MAVTAGHSGRLWLVWTALLALTVLGVSASFRVLVGHPATWTPVLIGVAAAALLGLAAGLVPRLRPAAPRVVALTFVGCGLVTLALVTYLVLVVGFSGTPHGTERRVLALSMVAAVVAVVFAQPVRERLVDLTARWVQTTDRSPTAALDTFGARMSRAVPMDELLLQLAETLRDTIAPAGAEIWTDVGGILELSVSVPERPRPPIALAAEDAAVVARARATGNAWAAVWLPALLEGREDRHLRIAPVAHLGHLLGLIVVTREGTDTGYDESVDGVLADLARQVGLALHNVRLDSALQASLEELQQRNAELQASRARIVAAADESRRRIERNLHDGAQQHLVALAVKLGLARQLMGDAAPDAAGLVEELRTDVQTTIGELRELAHGIYPPLLRDRGLGEALRAAGGRAPLTVNVCVETQERFDPELEAAVYFCCLEALQNAGKHAGVDATVSVHVARADCGLQFVVRDDGKGFDPHAFRTGHGFTNMADRVGAMGGRLDVDAAPGRGASISGWVPCPALPAEPRAPVPAPPA